MHAAPFPPSRAALLVTALFCLALLSAACGGEPAPAGTPTNAATAAPTFTATAAPSASPTPSISPSHSPQAPTIAPTATLTLTAQPSATAEPSPTPGGTLTAGGPWLLLEQARPDRAAPGVLPDTRVYFAANADGSGFQQLHLPEPAEARTWLALPSERSASLAFLQALREGFSFNFYTDRERYEPFLWIARLPENRLTRQIPLLGPLGWEQVARERERIANRVEIPLTLGLVSDPRSVLWSPDGSRLAFSSGARGSAADIFLYLPEGDSLLGITNLSSVGAQPWFWSADGGWLIYRTGRRYTAQGLSRLSNAYALSMQPGSRPKKLYSPRTAEQVLGVTVLNFLVYEQAPESPPCRLRRVEYASGQVELLYLGCFAQAAAEPGGAILLNFNASPGLDADGEQQPAGIYRLDARTRQLALLLEGSYRLDGWDAQRRAFTAIPLEGGPPRLFRVNATGALVESDSAIVEYPAPNGRWRIRHSLPAGDDPGSLALVTAEGQTFTQLGPGPWSKIRWSPDSTAFYALRCAGQECALGFFERALGWQPVWIFNTPALRETWLIAP